MRTALFSPCFLEGKDALGSDRFRRNLRYIAYYHELMPNTDIWLADNASPFNEINLFPAEAFNEQWQQIKGGSWAKIYRFDQRLTGGGGYNYPYCWRALAFIEKLLPFYDKIVTIDSDCFVLSQRLLKYIEQCNSGWVSLWCRKYQFPEAAFHILNRDTYPLYLAYMKDGWQHLNGRLMETALPFTHINMDFVCDRFGEDRIPQSPEMDFYSQAPVDLPLRFGG